MRHTLGTLVLLAALGTIGVSIYQNSTLSWGSSTQGKVTVQHHAHDGTAMERAQRAAQEALDELTGLFDVSPRPFKVELFASRVDAIAWRGSDGWARHFEQVGQASPSRSVIQVLDDPELTESLEDTVRHEVAHLVLAWVQPGKLPRWVDEGIATWVEKGSRELNGEVLGSAFARGHPFPRLRNLERFPRDPEHESIAYLQSGSVVELLVQRHGKSALRTFVTELERGADGALRVAYGYGLDTLDDDWREHISLKYAQVPTPARSLPTPLPIFASP